MPKPDQFIEFGRFRLDVRNKVLYEDGRELELEPKPLKVFQFLLEHLDETFAADFLLKELWPDSHVEPANVSQAIHKIRKVLGEDRGLLEERRGIGYRLREYRAGPAVSIDSTGHAQVRPEKSRPTLSAVQLNERTYFKYRDQQTPLIDSQELVHHLEERYHCTLLSLCNNPIPVAVLWKNVEQSIHPDKLLGKLDPSDPTRFASSPTLSEREYASAREFIREQYESGPIRYDGCDYRMIRLELRHKVPKLHGAFGYYYDNILTQYAIEWELKKALLAGNASVIRDLSRPGVLPLREAIEAGGNPLISGHGRCAAITVSTLLIFKRAFGGFSCIIRRRTKDVGVSPGMLHVVPAGMFEASDTSETWSIELNVWRELLEEVYDEKDLLGCEFAEMLDPIREMKPIALLRTLIKNEGAEFSATGIVCDLLNLRTEICTVLFINDPAFAEARRMRVNWEYEPERRFGKFAVDWNRIDAVIQTDGRKYGIVPSGAACIALGREWAKRRHSI